MINSVAAGANCGNYTYEILDKNSDPPYQPFSSTVGIYLDTSTSSNTKIDVKFHTSIYSHDIET